MRMCSAIFLVALLVPITAGSQSTKSQPAASKALTNRDVLSLLKAGLPANVVVAKIKTSACHFNTSPKELETLKAESVPDSVILAMVNASSRSGKPDSAKASTSSSASKGSEEPGKPRVYVSDSQSWQMRGGFGVSNGTGGGAFKGGSSPQTVEVIKTFGQRCPQAVVTEDRDRASFVILFDRESFKGFLRKRDKIAVFHRNGDVLYTNSVRSVGNAVKDACQAILKSVKAKK